MPVFNDPSADKLLALETAPNMYLVLSPALYILTASDLYLEATETTRQAIVGKHIFQAFPDNPDLPEADGVRNIDASLQEVLRTKKPHHMSIQRYDVPDNANPGKFIHRYWDPSHTPVLDEHGDIRYIIQLATNVTTQVIAQEALAASEAQERQTLAQVEELNEELEAANEELTASNEELLQTQESLKKLNEDLENRIFLRTEELHAANEEMAAANEELHGSYENLVETQRKLEVTVSELKTSKERFRKMIQASPVAMLVTRGDNMMFEEINEAMLQMIGKDSSIKGKPWFEAIPELVGQPLIDELYHTYRTGNESKITEAPVTLMINGQAYHGYFNITYTALVEDGKKTGVMQSMVDVTGYINAKNELSKAYEQARLSKEAAQLGTFDMDLKKGTMEWDARCRLLFGISHQDTVTYEKDFITGLHPDDKERITTIINNVFDKSVSNGIYDVEYRTLGAEDQQLRWVRAKGQAYFDENDKAIRFIGSVLDITEQKQDEIRKNDFVSMVSHELKTPLTSLNAYVQVLQGRAKTKEDEFAVGAFAKIKSQVNKMTGLINGFLNISRLDSGKIHLSLIAFEFNELLNEVLEETRIIAPAYNLVVLPCSPVWVEADRDKIGQVLSNLLSNAVKYSPKGKTITLSCQQVDSTIQASVQDEGMGVKPESVNKLFDRFYRVETKHTQHISGFGIGLYLSSEIIQRHNGKIWAESEIGKGSTFYFSLPAMP